MPRDIKNFGQPEWAKLLETRQLLVQEGWTRKTWGDERKPKCYQMALSVVYGVSKDEAPLLPIVPTVLRAGQEITGTVFGTIVALNDEKGRTLQEMLAITERAAEMLGAPPEIIAQARKMQPPAATTSTRAVSAMALAGVLILMILTSSFFLA